MSFRREQYKGPRPKARHATREHDSRHPYDFPSGPSVYGNGSPKPQDRMGSREIPMVRPATPPPEAELVPQNHALEAIAQIDKSDLVVKKGFFVVYDPEIKKDPEKGSKPIYRAESSKPAPDPRKAGPYPFYEKRGRKSNKRVFKSLIPLKYAYDKHSLGPKPSNEIVVWGFPAATPMSQVKQHFKAFGSITEVRSSNDPVTAVPLGVCVVVYDGDADKAHQAACEAVKRANEKLKVNGSTVKCGLNTDNRLLPKITHIAIDKMKTRKRKEEKAQQEREARELKKKQEAEREAQRLAKERQAAPAPAPRPLQPTVAPFLGETQDMAVLSEILTNKKPEEKLSQAQKLLRAPKKSSHDRHIRDMTTVKLPKDIEKHINNHPSILIPDKYVSTSDISTYDIKRVLEKYEWTRVLTHYTGFYVVFSSLKEALRCFDREDGRRLFEYKMYMDLLVPPEHSDGETVVEVQKGPVPEQAAGIVVRELKSYLSKDIRDKVIASEILRFLEPANLTPAMVKLKEEQEAKEARERKEREEQALKAEASAIPDLPGVKKDSQALPQLPTFRRTELSGGRKKKLLDKKARLPMSHAMTYDNSSDEDDEEEEETEPEPRKKVKMETSFSSEEEVKSEDKHETSEPTSPEIEAKAEVKAEPSTEDMDLDDEKPLNAYSSLDEKYHPNMGLPMPVYEEDHYGYTEELERLQHVVKDEEDFEILKLIAAERPTTNALGDIHYWAWKQLHIGDALFSSPPGDVEEVTIPELQSKTGSMRTEGYQKIPDSQKVNYLPHRRKVHKPLNTIQTEEEDTHNSTSQSSRVNRANNRRFAADISAQKQMLGSETDILDLNQLTKRKKPVSFARSAIHNWGLYALEPIAAKEMIIEYVGERLRQQVAEVREKKYLKSGIGSSYLFRVDENTVIDATKKGGIARFINHCCVPSCTAKIIKVEGKKRIVIYALRDIATNEELTYDYKFERETNDEERIPCLCGAPGCKGYLN